MKPKPVEIKRWVPLSDTPQPADRFVCSVCGFDSKLLETYQEHDEFDRVTGRFIFLGLEDEHARCGRFLEDHPRLYTEAMGAPGSFGMLCGGCTLRVGSACTHPSLKANGGPGMSVGMNTPFKGVIIKTTTGCYRPPPRPLDCDGQKLRGEP